MSDNSGSKKLLLLAGGAVVAAGAAWYLLKGREDEPEPVLVKKAGSAKSTSAAKPEASAAQTAAVPAAAAADDESGMGRQTTTAMVQEYSFVAGDNASTHDAAKDKPKVYQPPVPDANGVIFFESVGVRLQLSRGWSASEETTPMPNIAMLNLTKADFSERQPTGMPGEIPVVLMSIEDISNECIGVEEFREKSRNLALSQMQAMTNGMFQPRVIEDAKLDTPIGPFTHILMYELQTPYFSMQVMNLTTVVEGLAYIVQVMSNPNEFQNVRKEAVTMAKTFAIERRTPPEDFRTIAGVTVTGSGCAVTIPPAWSVEKTRASNPLATVKNASTTRREQIEVYDLSAEKAMDLSKSNVTAEKDVRGVSVKDYGNSMRVATKGDVAVVCVTKHKQAVVTPVGTLASICESVDLSKKAESDEHFYHSQLLHLGFNMAPAGRIIESRVSERILVYAPAGLPTEPTEEIPPMLTVRVGDPSNDPDCRTSYEAWMQRIKEETDSDSISELKKDTQAGRDCVTFLNKEMQEVGPGMKEERTAKVVIFLSGERTTMLRWETPTNAWRKHEGKLKAVINSLQIE